MYMYRACEDGTREFNRYAWQIILNEGSFIQCEPVDPLVFVAVSLLSRLVMPVNSESMLPYYYCYYVLCYSDFGEIFEVLFLSQMLPSFMDN